MASSFQGVGASILRNSSTPSLVKVRLHHLPPCTFFAFHKGTKATPRVPPPPPRPQARA